MFGGKLAGWVKDFISVAAGIAGILALGFAALAIVSPPSALELLPDDFVPTPQTIYATVIVSSTPDPNVQPQSEIVEVTRIVEVPVEITRIVEVPGPEVEVEVTRIVEVTREVAVVPTQPPAPPATSTPYTPANFMEYRDWWSENGIELRTSKMAWAPTSSRLTLWMEIYNGTDAPLIFQWSSSRNFRLIDNTGYIYDTRLTYDGNRQIGVGQTQEFADLTWENPRFFSDEVKDLYLIVTDIAGTSQMTWRIHVKD